MGAAKGNKNGAGDGKSIAKKRARAKELHPEHSKVTGRPETWTFDKIAVEAEALIIWSEKSDSLVLKLFASSRRYSPPWLSYLADKSATFSEALSIAKANISGRREITAGKEGGIDSGIVRATLANYDRDHKTTLIEIKTAERQGQVSVYADAMLQSKKTLDKEIELQKEQERSQ